MGRLSLVLAFVICGLVRANAAEVAVFCPGAVQTVMHDLAAEYQKASGNSVRFNFGTAGAIAKRVADGEAGDVVITTDTAQAKLAAAGKVVASTVKPIGAMGVGVAVRKGAPKPDIHDVAAFKASMRAAKSIMFADPAKGGQSGIHVASVFKNLGIDKELAPKLRLRDRSPDGLKEVAAGDIEIGLGQISEILGNPDVVLVGSLPSEIQGLVVFAASEHEAASDKKAAEALVQFITTPAAKERFKQAGFTVN